jgi:hypothetical protein
MRAPRLRAALAALAVTPLLATVPPATAQAPTGTVQLASQTPWVTPGSELDLRVNVATNAKPTDLELAVSIYRPTTSRSQFLLTLKDRLTGTPVSTTATTLSQLEPDAAGALLARIPIQDPAQPLDRNRLRLRDEGVYPVRVELRQAGGGAVLDRFTTHLVYASAPAAGASPLRFAWVAPMGGPPAVQPDGTRKIDAAATTRLATLAQALDAHPTVPVVLNPSAETVESLAQSAKEGDRAVATVLARVAKGRPMVDGTYVPVSPSVFVGNGADAEFAAQLGRGRSVIESLLGSRPDAQTWVADDHLDETALDRLRAQQVDRVIVPESGLSPVAQPVTLAQPFELQTRSVRRPVALAADDQLAAHFLPNPVPGEAHADDPVLRAHQLLADLAVVYFDSPGKVRGAVAVPVRAWAPDQAFLEALLDGLASSPVIKTTTLDDLFATVPPATAGRSTLTRSLVPGPPPTPLPFSSIRTTRHRLDAFGSMLDADNPIGNQLEEVLLASQAADLRGRSRTTYIRGVDQRIDQELARIVVPPSRTITLTARRGEIPVTVQHKSDYPVHLVVSLESDKLTFPDGSSRKLDLVRRNTTDRFVVQARTSGAFPLRVTLWSPGRDLMVARARFTVRSTAASGVGIALSVGAGVILLGWWARHLVRGRRNKRLVPA